MPQIIVKSDYDGYFEGLVKNLLAQQPTPRSEKIVVSAGPYRSAAVSYEWDESTKTMHLDFYSALRRGFGYLSQQDKTELAKLL